jgi:16S rRNA (guanine(966)-N(2))-methyltransferase RsmD
MAIKVIGGTAGGVPLRVPRGQSVRPTTGRVRTALFNIVAPELPGARVVDLFAGCGALGIEALSRGAHYACFVENAPDALDALEANLAKTRLAHRAEVLRANALAAAPLLAQRAPLHLILADPPYALLRRAPKPFLSVLEELARSEALADDAAVVVQHDSRTELPERIGTLLRGEPRRYGTTALTLFRRQQDDPEKS